ncbi:hypothetical protein F4861DRAFT_542035 [Xylaria intraflava]|nr:hypothetical protein F4861DRAFT_542035 [Xylaria intraflava]
MSADLFAAFEDSSQPPQQTQSKPPSTQPAYIPSSFGLPLNPTGKPPNQRWSQPPSVLNQSQHAWQTSRPSSAYNLQPAPVTTSTFSNPQPTHNDDTGDDDGWGDFEVAPNTGSLSASSQPAIVTPNSVASGQPTRTVGINMQSTERLRASTLDLVSNNLIDAQVSTDPTWPSVNPRSVSKPPERKVQMKATHTDPKVLFDADDFELDGDESDDDFGEFETVPPPVQPPSDLISSASPVPSSSNTNVTKKPSELLIDLNFSEPTATYTQATKPTSVPGQAAVPKQEAKKSKPFSEPVQSRIAQAHAQSRVDSDIFPGMPKPPAKSPTKPTAPISDWAWDTIEPPKSIKTNSSPIKKSLTTQSHDNTATQDDTSWDWDPVDIDPVDIDPVDIQRKQMEDVENSALPPVNIPPPSIILSVFPQLFSQANDYLYKPVSDQPPTIKDRILSDPRVYDFLGGYLSLATVAARVIAGRKMRWHRDKFLSQSMSISAAGGKGMKLAGVDKTQAVREDREAADVVSNWKSQVGRLKSTVAAANSANKSGGRQLKIPEITDTMQVQTAKDVPTAPKACVICGLKRNERLTRVDHEVEDSFGEWWAEHWGHVACKRFWLQHENTLRQR